MKTKTISYEDDDVQAAITVRAATVRDGMQRGRLLAQAFEHPESDDTLQTLRVIHYPACVSAAEGQIVLEGASAAVDQLAFKAFIGLPERLVEMWLTAVYEINPHWSPHQPVGDDVEKKAAS
jgi:hypothetical protein